MDIISISTLVTISVVMCKDLKWDQGPVVFICKSKSILRHDPCLENIGILNLETEKLRMKIPLKF